MGARPLSRVAVLGANSFGLWKEQLMRVPVIFLVGTLLSACAATDQGLKENGGAPELWDKPLTEEESEHIAQVEADGRLLYRKDQFAARATDLLLGAIDLADYPHFVGWVGYEGEEGFVISFYSRHKGDVSLIADVTFGDNGSSMVELDQGRKLTDREVSMLNARMAALEEGTSSCSNRFNTVVMPSSEADDAWTVYVLAATTNPGVVVAGGHSRVRVSKQTGKVNDVEHLSSSCMVLDKPGAKASVPEGSVLVFTHVVTPMPIPVYPYLSLLHKQPLAVISERGKWLIAGDNISQM